MITLRELVSKLKKKKHQQQLVNDPHSLLEENLIKLFKEFNPERDSICCDFKASSFNTYIFTKDTGAKPFRLKFRYNKKPYSSRDHIEIELSKNGNQHSVYIANEEVLELMNKALVLSQEYVTRSFCINLNELENLEEKKNE